MEARIDPNTLCIHSKQVRKKQGGVNERKGLYLKTERKMGKK
jgi:hypothetical protein